MEILGIILGGLLFTLSISVMIAIICIATHIEKISESMSSISVTLQDIKQSEEYISSSLYDSKSRSQAEILEELLKEYQRRS